jgi:hypothetical protein
MSCLGMNQRATYVGVKNRVFILMRISQAIQAEYTLRILDPSDKYSTNIIRSKLMRDVAATFNETREELAMAMDDFFPICEDSTWYRDRPRRKIYLTQHAEWVNVPILQTLQRVICRSTNRMFVGIPLCS